MGPIQVHLTLMTAIAALVMTLLVVRTRMMANLARAMVLSPVLPVASPLAAVMKFLAAALATMMVMLLMVLMVLVRMVIALTNWV